MNFRATRPVTVKCLAAVTSCIILLLSLTYSPIEVDITDTQLGMGEQVSLTRFLCCACHARGEGSAFFGTRSCIFRAVQGVKMLVRACSRFLCCTVTPSGRRIMKPDQLVHQDIGQRDLCRLRAQKVPPPTRYTHMIPDIGMHGFHIGI